MITNNIDQPAFIYENETNVQSKNNYLEINLKGAGANTQGIGAKVIIYAKGKNQFFGDKISFSNSGYTKSNLCRHWFLINSANVNAFLNI